MDHYNNNLINLHIMRFLRRQTMSLWNQVWVVERPRELLVKLEKAIEYATEDRTAVKGREAMKTIMHVGTYVLSTEFSLLLYGVCA